MVAVLAPELAVLIPLNGSLAVAPHARLLHDKLVSPVLATVSTVTVLEAAVSSNS